MVARRSGTNTRQGKRQGQAAKQPDPPSWGCDASITKIKAQEGKVEPDARLCVLDTVAGHAQPDQYGGHDCRLGSGAAHPSRCQAFLRLAAFAQSRRLRVRSGRCGDGSKGAKSAAARALGRVRVPNADPFMLHIYAAVAEQERTKISERTKAALAAAKDRAAAAVGT